MTEHHYGTGCHVHQGTWHLQGQGLHHRLGPPIPMSNHPVQKFLLNAQLKLHGSSLRLRPLVLSLVSWDQSLTLTWLHPGVREL